MQTHKKRKTRILSLVLSAAMVTTMMPATVFATEGGKAPGVSLISTIQSFEKLENRFQPSTGEGASKDVYALNVELDTLEEDLQLPEELIAMVARTIPDDDNVVDEDTATDDTVSGNQPASPSDAKEEVKDENTEIKDDDVPLAPEPEQDKETVATTVEQETIPVTWKSDKEYKSNENGKFIYTAVLPEGYNLADGVSLPQIYVFVGQQTRTAAAAMDTGWNPSEDALPDAIVGQEYKVAIHFPDGKNDSDYVSRTTRWLQRSSVQTGSQGEVVYEYKGTPTIVGSAQIVFMLQEDRTQVVKTYTIQVKKAAVDPAITTDLSTTEVTYNQNATATALSIAASSTDGGTLSYAWYSNTSNSSTGGTLITAATTANYTPPTASTGTTYYYCIVKNTISDNGDGGTATTTSSVAKITVNAAKTPSNIAVSTPPIKTAYTVGQTFDKTGMIVTVTYTDGTTAAVSGYTFTPNTALEKADTTITFSYTENGTTVTTTQAITVTDAPTTHTITASASAGGSITPSGTVTINNGESKTFTIYANSNCSISSVSVDGVNQGAISTYTFSNVTGNHTISATFIYNGGGSSGGDSGGGSSSGGSTTTPPASKPTEPVTGNSNTNATVDNKGNATVNVTDKNISDAVQAAKNVASKKGVNAGEVTAVINVTSPANSNPNTVAVNLPKTVQDQIISNKIGHVVIVIDKPHISIGMTLATITEMNKQAKADIQLSATRADATKLSTEAKNAIGSRPAFDLKATYASGSKSVTNFGSGTVSVAIPYTLQAGEVAGGLQAVYVDGNGKVTHLTNSSYDAENKVLRFSTNHFSVYGIGYKTGNFTDVKADAYYVNWAASKGITSGTTATTFSSDTTVTRQEMAVFYRF